MNNLIILRSKKEKEQTFVTYNNLDKFHSCYAEREKNVSVDHLLDASVIWHFGKDKILVMENTIVARSLGWKEEMNIKHTIRQFLEVIHSFCILIVLVITGVMHVLTFTKLHSIKKQVNSPLWMLKHSSNNIFTTALKQYCIMVKIYVHLLLLPIFAYFILLKIFILC